MVVTLFQVETLPAEKIVLSLVDIWLKNNEDSNIYRERKGNQLLVHNFLGRMF